MKNDLTLMDGEDGSVLSPGVIYSGNMGPCIAVGLYDHQKKCGYMIHKSNADNDDAVAKFLDDVLTKSKRQDLKVCAAGGQIDRSEDEDDEHNINEHTESCREHVKDLLAARFDKSQYKLAWNNTARGQELILCTKTGEFKPRYDSFADDDDFDDGD